MRTTSDPWWGELDQAVLEALAVGPLTASQLSEKLGMSEASVTSLLALLAQEQKVHVVWAARKEAASPAYR